MSEEVVGHLHDQPAALSCGEKYLDPSNNHFIFRINECETEEFNYTSEELSVDFDENNLTRGVNVV